MDNECKECNVATCEYWATPNNCKKCENTCKYFGFGGCKLEMERCYKIDDCYYKQLLAEQAKNKKLVEALESVNKKFPINDKYIFKNDIENICRILFNIRDITQQALNEVNKC